MPLLSISACLNGNGLVFQTLFWSFGSYHFFSQIKSLDIDDPESCNKNFKSNHWFGIIVMASLWADYIYEKHIKNVKCILNDIN